MTKIYQLYQLQINLNTIKLMSLLPYIQAFLSINLNDNYNDFDKIKKLFINSFSNKEWTDKKYKTLSDWDRYTLTDIKKKKFPICNFYIKYESINDDLKKLCNTLKIKEDVMLPEFKTNYRKNDKKYQDYYDEKTKKFIYNLCKNEIKFHKYGF